MMKGEKQNMDLGKNYAGILAKIIFEAKNSKKMKFKDIELCIRDKNNCIVAWPGGYSDQELASLLSRHKTEGWHVSYATYTGKGLY